MLVKLLQKDSGGANGAFSPLFVPLSEFPGLFPLRLSGISGWALGVTGAVRAGAAEH